MSDNILLDLRKWEQNNAVDVCTTDAPFCVTPNVLSAADGGGPPRGPRPWDTDPEYFHSVCISAVALLRMAIHARSGKGKRGIISHDAQTWVEVMGLCQGYVLGRSFVITDSFGLPVDASEVECAMTDASVLYQVDVLSHTSKLGRLERCCGWYHSHPGYSCFLSGIDVGTQTANQAALGPWVALVIDPVRSISTGAVEIKAFRTYPEGHRRQSGAESSTAAIPTARLEEAGAHMNRYYELPIRIFRSERDASALAALWRSYWAPTFGVPDTGGYTASLLREVPSKAKRSERRVPLTSGPDDGVDPPLLVPRKPALEWGVSLLAADVVQGLLLEQIKGKIFSAP